MASDRLDYLRIANNSEAKGSGPTLGSSAIRPSAAVRDLGIVRQ